MTEYLNARREELIKQFNTVSEQNNKAQNTVRETSEIMMQIRGALTEIDIVISKMSAQEVGDEG